MKQVTLNRIKPRKVTPFSVSAGVLIGRNESETPDISVPVYLKWDDGSQVLWDDGSNVLLCNTKVQPVYLAFDDGGETLWDNGSRIVTAMKKIKDVSTL